MVLRLTEGLAELQKAADQAARTSRRWQAQYTYLVGRMSARNVS